MDIGSGRRSDEWSALYQANAETRTVTNGLEVHETALILRAETPTHLLTNESCANAQAGWKIVPDSVKTEVVTARMMDPGGDPDWKVEKAEGADKTRQRQYADLSAGLLPGTAPVPMRDPGAGQLAGDPLRRADIAFAPCSLLSGQPLRELGAISFGHGGLITERHRLLLHDHISDPRCECRTSSIDSRTTPLGGGCPRSIVCDGIRSGTWRSACGPWS